MNDETWIRELAQAAKDEAEAERAEVASEAREALDAFRPLGPEFKARMMAMAREKLKGEESPSLTPPVPDPASAISTDPPATPPAPLTFAPHKAAVPAPRQRPQAGRFWPWMATAATAAAAIVLMLRPQGGALPPLPPYDSQLAGGVATHRGSDESPKPEVWTYRQGSRLDLVLTPRTAVGREVEARCVLVRERELRSCEKNLRRSEQGAIQIAGTIGEDLSLDSGAWTLCVAVGWPGGLPGGDEVCADGVGEEGVSRSWRGWKYDLRIE